MVATRAILGFFTGFTIGLFGVFIFSNSVYMGISIVEIFGRITSSITDISKFSAGFYELFFFSFYFDFFSLFNPETYATINLMETLFPPLMGWLFAGLISGAIIKGIKRSVMNSVLIVVVMVVLLLCLAIISGANLTFVFALNIISTLGGIMTALISLLIGGIIGSSLSGKYID
jgi:hypothetical protein